MLPAGSEPVTVSVQLGGGRALVVVGSGHAARTDVRARPGPERVIVSLPGRPASLKFDLRLQGRSLLGPVRQGEVSGTASLLRGALPDDASLGAYRLGDETLGVSEFGVRFGTVYEQGEIHRLYRSARGIYAIGAGIDLLRPAVGTVRFSGTTATWKGAPARRLPVRQLEVRFGGGGAQLGGTLTLPAGAGPFPAVALAHGSGLMPRESNSILTSFFVSRGLAVLAYDKRGVGQSGGRFPGEAATATNIDKYAKDAAAAARFLAAQPEIDRSRVGLSGASQAGWIMPLAAAREPAVRFLVILVGPAVTQGESDNWGSLTGQGSRDPGDLAELERQVRQNGPSGFDPLPSIRALRIPALWIYGGNDLNVPTRLCVERLEPLTREAGRDFSYVVYPRAAHSLSESDHGLTEEIARSSHYPKALWPSIERWLAVHGLRG